MSRLFVTGTDTGVGKTTVSAALAGALRRSGRTVAALKPVASGVDAGAGEDAELLAAGAGHEPRCAVALRAPLSPHRAAAMEGVRLDLGVLLDWIGAWQAEAVLVEGAGGWEVPYAPDWRVADLAAALGWPVLVVARNRLGVLNHTLLTVAAVRARGAPLLGVVLNGADDGSAVGNLEDLRALLPDLTVEPFPWDGTPADADTLARRLGLVG